MAGVIMISEWTSIYEQYSQTGVQPQYAQKAFFAKREAQLEEYLGQAALAVARGCRDWCATDDEEIRWSQRCYWQPQNHLRLQKSAILGSLRLLRFGMICCKVASCPII
ncbi:unnamed protein product [Durusdinium trenchii]|uniref:Uncharacterized protein n=1 Tax=Durusdinium trenchii TaxID=1381693 RepID=A0ABP0S9A1_9DINO